MHYPHLSNALIIFFPALVLNLLKDLFERSLKILNIKNHFNISFYNAHMIYIIASLNKKYLYNTIDIDLLKNLLLMIKKVKSARRYSSTSSERAQERIKINFIREKCE